MNFQKLIINGNNECGVRRIIGAFGFRGDGDDITFIKVSLFNTPVRTSKDTVIITCNYRFLNR
jgi:hypothetical protein